MNPEEVIKWLRICATDCHAEECKQCPYNKDDRLHRQHDPHLPANCRGGHAARRASADRKEAPVIDEPTLQCTG